MPTSAPRPCRGTGCRLLTTAPDGFCDAHRRDWRQRQDAHRPSARRRGYDTAWEEIRVRILARDPICRDPAGCTAPSTDVDHVIARADGGSEDDGNLRGLCHRHHSRKTVLVDGGFRR